MSFLTSQEKTIIKFLAGFVLFGMLVLGYRSLFPPKVPPNDIDINAFKAKAEKTWVKPERTSAENREIQTIKSVNINTSNKAELMSIPGIGPVMAERIIRYREDFGPFKSPKDVQEIKGIGPKIFKRIEPYLMTEDL